MTITIKFYDYEFDRHEEIILYHYDTNGHECYIESIENTKFNPLTNKKMKAFEEKLLDWSEDVSWREPNDSHYDYMLTAFLEI